MQHLNKLSERIKTELARSSMLKVRTSGNLYTADNAILNIPASRKQNAIQTLIYLLIIVHVAIRIADCMKT